ncbi:uncharacterized protein LOC128221627 [Mya arenaria]|uniref:uncharacterized protein LOC128221627 n=1 Tax=Mya arenaria TaxID=6604 RepID=UPI0022E6E9EF|nr:uncharacterized protein LOC128221627 [Mya arenaria]
MNQINCVIVTILYCFGVTVKGLGVFVSHNETKWDESTCNLAKPDIICSGDGSCVIENGLEFLNNIKVPDNGIWIGFTKAWISYAYVGCNQVNVGVEYSVSTLGECRRTTGCQTFGIRNSTEGLRCKCASNSQVFSGTCRRKCEEADQYPCGDTTDTTMFSIYTVENVPPNNHSQDNEANCLVFYYAYGGQGHDFYWKSCNLFSTPTLLCSGTNFSDQNQMAQRYHDSNQRWALAVDHCFVRERFPVTIRSIKNAKFTIQNTNDYWTGIIKKESIISSNYKADYSINPPVTYAYVEQINQTFKVRFSNKVESKKSLCAGGKGSTVGLAAGLSISVALLFVAMIIVLLFLRKRGLLPKLCKHNDDKNSNTADTATEVSFVSTSICESTTNTMQDLTASNHSYFVLEKTFEITNKDETDHYAEPDISDADHHDSTKTLQKNTDNNYDTINSEKPSAMPGLTKLNNTYNKVTLHQTDEYDHVHLNGRQTKDDRHTENEYDLSSNVIDGRRDKGYDDNSDTYNR